MAGRCSGWPSGGLRGCRGVGLGAGRRHQAEAASAEVLAARLPMASSSSPCRWHQRPSGPGSSWPATAAARLGAALDERDEAGMRAVLPSLLRALDAIRGIDVAGSTGYGIWAPDSAGPHPSWQAALLSIADDHDRIAGWRRVLQTSPAAAGAFAKAHARLQSMAGALPGTRHIIHGDLLNHNVLVNGSRISGVIDWGNAAYGDWLYDAAWLLYWWPWYPAWRRIDLRAELDPHWTAGHGPPADFQFRLRSHHLHT